MHLSEEEFNTLVEARKILTRICNEFDIPYKLLLEVNKFGDGEIKSLEFISNRYIQTKHLQVFDSIFNQKY